MPRTDGHPDDASVRASERESDRAEARASGPERGRGDRPRRKPESEREPQRKPERAERPRRGVQGVTAREAAAHAALHVEGLTGSRPEGVTSLERSEKGWNIGIEALESHRIPDSTDILAEYRVEVDEEGDLISYHRERRYHRSRAQEKDS